MPRSSTRYPRSASPEPAAGPGELPGSARACLHACRHGGGPEPQKRFAKAWEGSPGKLSGARSLYSPGFGRYQVTRKAPRSSLLEAQEYLVKLFGIDELEECRRGVELVTRRASLS
eukprot:4893088-Pyramimonas_sp.AAC.1